MSMGMLPTPMASDATTGAIIGKNDIFVETKGLPRKINQNGTDGSVGLGRLVQMLPTPNAFDWNTAQRVDKYEERKKIQAEKGINLHYPLKQLAMDVNPTGTTSQLSPQFVMEMMGFPTDWTLLPFLNGETNQSKQEETQ
jgi:hypothetical protein